MFFYPIYSDHAMLEYFDSNEILKTDWAKTH